MTPAQNTAAYIKGFEDGERATKAKMLRELESQEPVAVKHIKKWIEFLKRQSDNGQHMNIPSGLSAKTCWELAIELEQFIDSHTPQRTELDVVAAELRAALAWGMTYGPIIPSHQWDEMREQQINTALARIGATPPAQPALPPIGWVKLHRGGLFHEFDMEAASRLPEDVKIDIHVATPAQPAQAQEILGWLVSDEEGDDDFVNNPSALEGRYYQGNDPVPLGRITTTPPVQPAPVQPDLSNLKPSTQAAIKEWLAEGTFVERAICVIHEQELKIMNLEQVNAKQAATLTDEQIKELIVDNIGMLSIHAGVWNVCMDVARSIEAAHGITEKGGEA